MAPQKVIIDTDPGCDDVLAMLLAFSALPEELEVLLISVTYGNVELEHCLKNVISLFYYVEKELAWRREQGRPLGFDSLRNHKPVVAAGPKHPLAEQMLIADFFHGRDGLGDVRETHPHLTPSDTWEAVLSQAAKSSRPEDSIVVDEMKKSDALFTASHTPAHQEILNVLRQNEPDSVSIVAIGPLTNLALAAAEDPETFLRVKDVVVMGGTVHASGNVASPLATQLSPADAPEPPFRLIKQPPGPIRDALTARNQITPVAEFNTFADSFAAARLYALTSPNPATTMPPQRPLIQKDGIDIEPQLKSYPDKLSRQLRVTLFPLDITSDHLVTRGEFRKTVEPLVHAKSPLADWTKAWMDATFNKVESLHSNITGDEVGLQLHDPLTVWYCMAQKDPKWQLTHDEDIRVETAGQWTRGMCVTDGRSRKKRADDDVSTQVGDHGEWLRGGAGNRLRRCVQSPGEDIFGTFMLQRIFTP